MTEFELQWSRTLTSAEIESTEAGTESSTLASMEPHSYECGNCIMPEMLSLFFRLQWSRTLTSAEILKRLVSKQITITLQWSRTLTSAEIGHVRIGAAR